MLITLHLCVLCGSQKKEKLLPYTPLADWVLEPKWRAFTARYELSTYNITQIPFALKGLNIKYILNIKISTHRSEYTTNNTRRAIKNPCTAANYTSCHLKQFCSFLICLSATYQ